MRTWGVAATLLLAAPTPACSNDEASSGVVSLSKATAPASEDPSTIPAPGGPRLGAIKLASIVYEKAEKTAPRLGYLRAGATVLRSQNPVSREDCEGGWYRILPRGYVCAGSDVTTDLQHPLLRALTRRPDLSKPMPYPYAFVRAIAPNYYRVPSQDEQFEHEMRLKEHLRSYKKLQQKWDAVTSGANDVPLDAKGNAVGEAPTDAPYRSDNEIYGGRGDDAIPWFFQGGRKIPNIATFKVPDYAVMTNRVARHAGLALIDSFMGDGDRRMSMTTDARLVPSSKLKPAMGSTFHGVEMESGTWKLPLGFVKVPDAKNYAVEKGRAQVVSSASWHSSIQLTGRSQKVGANRYVEAQDGSWLDADDLAIAVKPSDLPNFAKGSYKWIDISILAQTLILYEGDRPVYATAVATGRDGLGDPKTTHSTLRGDFRIREKHVTTTMDAHEVDNKFELRDVPWVQYFEAGYAIHAALWHDDFGKPRSHGCINLSPIDARRVFFWTDPPLAQDWHGTFTAEATGPGTHVHIHP